MRRAAFIVLLTWLALAGYILGRFANDAFPTYYLYRPLAAAVPLAVVIGLLVAWRSTTYAPMVAGAVVAAITFWASWTRFAVPILLVGVALLVVARVVRRRGRTLPTLPRAVSTAATVFIGVFFASGLVRAVLTLEGPIAPVEASADASGPNLYLVLLDGYPRGDTLMNDFGIDNAPFEQALEGRGFDMYRDALSDRRNTDFTLLALLNGTTVGVPPDTDLSQEGQWERRRQLSEAVLPIQAQEAGYEYWVVDSPAGFVTFTAGTHIQNGGINTLEEYMLASSALGPVVKLAWPTFPTDSVRDHFDHSVDSIVSLADPDSHRLVLGHLFEPHLPFLWDTAGNPEPVPEFWPRWSLFVWQIEHVGMSVDEFGDLLAGDLATVNPRLLAMVDEIVARDPGAVIVLFSDHGSRYSLELQETEWHRSFLAARTPGHQNLFGPEPTTTDILRTLLPTYVTAE